MTEADMIISGVVVVVFGLVFLMSWYGIRLRKRADVAGRQLTVDDLLKLEGSKLQGSAFVWGLTQGHMAVKQWQLRLFDEKGAPVTDITYHEFPFDGVIAEFDLDGRRYHYRKERPVGGRMLLCDAQTGQTVLSSLHGALKSTFYREQSDHELCTVDTFAMSQDYMPVTRNDCEIGRMYYAKHPDCMIRVFKSGSPPLSRLEQCFLIQSLSGRG